MIQYSKTKENMIELVMPKIYYSETRHKESVNLKILPFVPNALSLGLEHKTLAIYLQLIEYALG